MLTTTLDGLWALQVLSGTEVLAPELGLRPHLPRVETPQTALAHPVTQELRSAGVIDAAGTVDETIVEWLTVLSRRDVAVLLHVQTPATDPEPQRILLARFAHWWVCLERSGHLVRLSGAGTATSERSAGLLITAQIERLCGAMEPAPLKPATIDSAEILGAVKDRASLRDFLINRRFDSEQIAMLTVAADRERSAQAAVVAIQTGAGDGPTRAHIPSQAVTIIDTPHGRLVSEHVQRGGKAWMIVSPGSTANISSAVRAVLRNLPAQEQWFSYRNEFYSLVERHHDGRPDMIGMEAVNQLLVALEAHRFDFCFIGAGYEREVDDFLEVNPGLAGRFNRKLRFESYSPGDLVEIAARYGGPRATVLDQEARVALSTACQKLRAFVSADGTHGIDLLQNGRFARNVVERAERLRDSRVAAQNRTDKGSVTVTDLETLRTHDILTAVADACADKHVPITL